MATIARRLGPLDHGRRMTLEEYLEAEGDAEAGYRYELARGVVEVTKKPGTRDGQVVSNLLCGVAGYSASHPGVVLRLGGGNDFQFVIPILVSGRNPDLGVVLRDPSPRHDRDPRAALAAEVVSARSGHRDYVVKREEYLAYGLAEYWIVDFLARRFTLLVREGDAWSEEVIADDRAIPSLVLPGLATTVADLWRDLDYYDPDGADEDEAIDPPA